MIKRIFDIVFATGVLILAGPLILIAGLAVKLTSAGPAFYRAQRAGRYGQRFSMYKLRTMYVGQDALNRRITDENDDRVTPVGKFLRKFEIDELPQFLNVLWGQMSVVGPRPEDWDIVQQYYTSEQRRTLDVRPGIVSPVDVYWYPDITFHDPPPAGVPLQEHYLRHHLPIQLAQARDYVEHQNFWLDMSVIAQTAFCIFIRSWLLPPKPHPLAAERSQTLTSQS